MFTMLAFVFQYDSSASNSGKLFVKTIAGLLLSTSSFFTYLSVNVTCPICVRIDFFCGMNFHSMSSMTMYRASLSHAP